MNTAIAKQPLRQVGSIKQLLVNEEARGQLAAVAAKHMNPERMMRVVANAIRTTPKLQSCEPLSFLGALMQCAALGLEPNTVLGHAYLIPFDKSVKDEKGRWQKIPQVQLVIGYKGLIDLARRSGHITSISANIHYSDDPLWEYEEGTEARLRHQPGAQEGEKLHAYAIAKFKDGGHGYVVLPWAKVMKIRDGSQNWQSAVKYGKTESTPWHTHEDAMAMKTAIRALAKYLPLSVEFMDAVQIDNDSGARVDYAAFAMNPNDGPTIEGSFTEDDPDAEGDDPQPEENPEEQDKGPTKEPEQKQSAEKPDDGPASAHQAVFESLVADLADGMPVERVDQFYSEKLDAMKRDAPDLHASLMKEIEEWGSQ